MIYSYAKQLAGVVRFMILKSNVTMAMAAIFGAFPIILVSFVEF